MWEALCVVGACLSDTKEDDIVRTPNASSSSSSSVVIVLSLASTFGKN